MSPKLTQGVFLTSTIASFVGNDCYEQTRRVSEACSQNSRHLSMTIFAHLLNRFYIAQSIPLSISLGLNWKDASLNTNPLSTGSKGSNGPRLLPWAPLWRSRSVIILHHIWSLVEIISAFTTSTPASSNQLLYHSSENIHETDPKTRTILSICNHPSSSFFLQR